MRSGDSVIVRSYLTRGRPKAGTERPVRDGVVVKCVSNTVWVNIGGKVQAVSRKNLEPRND